MWRALINARQVMTLDDRHRLEASALSCGRASGEEEGALRP
jgi:hypothetical protein